MALQLTRKAKGVEANYWKITRADYNASSGQTYVVLSLYADKDARDETVNNILDNIQYYFSGYVTIPNAYVEIKKSQLVQNEVTPAEYVIGEDRVPVLPLQVIKEAVYENAEQNPFVSAFDC